MNTIVNLNMMVDKEIDLERQGHRRTRRWIGDAADGSWYRPTINKVAATRAENNPEKHILANNLNRDRISETFSRLSNLFSYRQPASRRGRQSSMESA